MVPIALNAADLKIGIIGLDTSHVIAFTKLINDPSDPKHVPGGRVVAAFKGGSADIESSRSRVDEYTRQLEKQWGIKIVPTVEALCAEVDAVLLESVDGRPHLEQVRPVFAAKKPVFIDKPLAGTLKDAIEIYKLGKQASVPWFTSSAYRYYESLQAVKKTDVGEVHGAISYGPAHLEPHHPDLFWYGIHPTEALFTILGPDWESLARTTTPSTDVVTATWKGGRTGTLYAIKEGATPHQVTVFGSKQVKSQQGSGDYAPLVKEIMQFFQTGKPPVSPEEAIAIYAFMEAADESRRQEGKTVSAHDILQRHGWTP